MSNNSSQEASAVLDRLKDAYELESDADLARMLEVAPNTVATWRNRGSVPFKRIVAQCDEVDLNWILRGSRTAMAQMQEEDYSVSEVVHIPIYDNAAGAGTGEVARDDVVAYGSFFREWLRGEVGVRPERAFIAPVRGRSMENLLVDGDLVLCEQMEEIRYQDIYVCRYEQELKVKHAHRSGGTVILRPENDRYPAIEVDQGDDFAVIGRVVRRVVR
jgi:phage repressor protein C with HTH and peptisase S24 domain